MTNLWQSGLTITHDPGGANNAMKDDFIAFPLLTDVGSGEVNQSILVLSADNGKYLSSAPILAQHDKIRIAHTDEFGDTYNKVFEIQRIKPIFNKQEGTKVELTLIDIGKSTQFINYIKPGRFETPFEMVKDIGNYYNVQRGTKQPQMFGHDDNTINKLPDYITNNFDFADPETPCYDRIIQVSDEMAGTAANQGVLDFFDVKLIHSTTDANEITLDIRSSGEVDSGVTIVDATDVNVGDEEGGIEAKRGNVIGAWGDVNSGSLPTDFTRYNSYKEAYDLYPVWVDAATATYKIGHRVRRKGVVYEALTNNSQQDPSLTIGTHWTVKTVNDIYGNVITYSPWTRQKANVTKNSGNNHGNATTGGAYGEGMTDGNLVVWDDDALRVPVDVRATVDTFGIGSNEIPAEYAYTSSGGNTGYRTLRVLVDTQLAGVSGSWAQNGGKDINDKPFADSVVQHNGGRYTGSEAWKNWTVVYEPLEDLLVSVQDEGRTYGHNGTNWAEHGSQAGQNDWAHPYESLDVDGGILVPPAAIGDTSQSANTQSAIKVVYEWNAMTLDIAAQNRAIANYYKIGAWYTLKFPFPANTYRSIAEATGELYGGGDNTTDDPREPCTIDAENMHFTHDGKRGFSHGLSSWDYGSLNSFDFFIKLKVEIDPLGLGSWFVPAGGFGDLKFRATAIDSSDNSVIADFTVPREGMWAPISLRLDQFETYRGRKPREHALAQIIPPKQLDPQNKFEWKNLKYITIQWQESYDGEGRYDPANNRLNIAGGLVGKRRATLWIDGVRFAKPALVVTDGSNVGGVPTDNVERQIEPDFIQRPNTLNLVQLEQDAKGELEKARFQRQEFIITTSGRYDIEFGETFKLNNPVTVGISDPSPGVITLVAKNINYSMTRPGSGGTGGFLRHIVGVKRFT
jgi:hypothetical protein